MHNAVAFLYCSKEKVYSKLKQKKKTKTQKKKKERERERKNYQYEQLNQKLYVSMLEELLKAHKILEVILVSMNLT